MAGLLDDLDGSEVNSGRITVFQINTQKKNVTPWENGNLNTNETRREWLQWPLELMVSEWNEWIHNAMNQITHKRDQHNKTNRTDNRN